MYGHIKSGSGHWLPVKITSGANVQTILMICFSLSISFGQGNLSAKKTGSAIDGTGNRIV